MSNALSEAIQYFKNNNFRAAEKACRTALKGNPSSADAHHLMGILKSKSGKLKLGIQHLEKAISLAPQHIEVRYNLGKGYRDLGRHKDAAVLFDTVLKSWPERSDVWVEMGIALAKTGDMARSAQAYEHALSLGLVSADVHSELARTYIDLYAFEAAESALGSALALNPESAPAQINMAILRDNQGRTDESVAIYESLLAADPTYHEASYRCALTLLSQERLETGWAAYANRNAWGMAPTCHGQLDIPYWSGEDLKDKNLLIWTEQGPGDEILLGSMLGDIAQHAESVTLACSPRLAPVFSESFADFKIVKMADGRLPKKELGRLDLQASLTEIGANLRPRIDNFPNPVSYLKVDQRRQESLHQKYTSGHTDKPVIGISWRSANKDASGQKSSSLTQWEQTLKQHNAHWVDLQYGDTSVERSTLYERTGVALIHDPDIDPITDIYGFAHQVAAMDLVVSTSNTTVHVAGGVGTDCWTLVPKGTGRPWYWFLDRPDSLWYPSMRLYRQSHAGNWTEPLTEVRDELSKWIHQWQRPK